MELTEAVRRRRMVRNYNRQPVPRDVLERIVTLARNAPSAGFAQGQRFIVVTDEARRRQIAALAHETEHVERGLDPWLSSAPAHVVLCVDRSAYDERYSAPDKRSSHRPAEWEVPYDVVDAGASMMLLLLAAVDEGLAAGFFGAHRIPGLRELLRLPEDVKPVGIVTIGHAAADRRSRSLASGWRSMDEVVHWEEWKKTS